MYTFKKGTNVSSYSIEKSSNNKTARDYVNTQIASNMSSGKILFDYNFTKEELVNEFEDLIIFARTDESGRFSMYFVEKEII